MITTTDYQGVSLTEAYDNRSVMAQIARIKDRLTAVEQNVDPALRTDLEAAVAELEALETTVSGIGTQVETNTGNIGDIQEDLGDFETSTTAALALKADSADVDADLDLKADKTQLTDGSVTKVGTANVGSTYKFVYLLAGVPHEGNAPAILDRAAQSFVKTMNFAAGVSIGTKATRTISPADLGKWVKLAIASTVAINYGLEARFVVSMPYNNQASPNGENGAASVFTFVLANENQSNYPFNERVYHHPGGEMQAVVTAEGSAGMAVYIKIPSYASQVTNRNTLKATMTCQSTLANDGSSSKLVLLGESARYDDIEYGEIHIPNITNYTSYKWAELPAGHGVISDNANGPTTDVTFRTF